MLKGICRAAAVFAFLAAFAATALVASAGVAHADGPDSWVHLYYTHEYYVRIAHSPNIIIPGNMVYNGGPVVIKSKTYAIYWAPSGHPIGSGYRSLLNRYFGDVGGTKFYHILTQYYKTGPTFIQNSSTFGGSWVDKTAYPHAGTPADPLQDADIQASVKRALTAKGWPTGVGAIYFVYTAQGIESCFNSTNCTPGTAHPAYCAYHGFFKKGTHVVLYANMPFGETWTTNCRNFSQSPNGNLAADAEISTTSHEHLEAVTDPKGNAWFDTHFPANEIGDKCAYNYGPLAVDGSDVGLSGNRYIVQQEWSNAANSGAGNCVLK